MFENFNIWMCFNKMLDALLLAFIPWKIFGVRNSWDRYAVLVLPFLVMFIVLYSVEMLLYPVNFIFNHLTYRCLRQLYRYVFRLTRKSCCSQHELVICPQRARCIYAFQIDHAFTTVDIDRAIHCAG